MQAPSADLPAEVQELVAAHAPHFSVVQEDGRTKVKCELNGHTFPAQAAALQAFVSGKKYAKLAAAAGLESGLAKYEPFIVRSKNLPGMLFCALTGELLGARLAEVKSHLKGKKFARAKERFEADEQELLEEPDMAAAAAEEAEAEGMEEDGPEGSDGPGFFVPDEVLQEYEMEEAVPEEEAGGKAAAQQEGSDGAAGEGKQRKEKRSKEKKSKQQQQAGEGAANGKGKQQKQQQQKKEKKGEKQQQQKGGKQQQNGSSAAAAAANGSSKAKPPKAKRARAA